MEGILPYLLLAALYALLGGHFWRSRWLTPRREVPAGFRFWERACLALLIVAHGHLLYGELFREEGMFFGFALALSLMLWLAVLIYWIESFHTHLEGLQPLVLPLAGVCALLPSFFPGQHLLPNAAVSLLFRIHFFVAMIAYSLFTLAALHASVLAMAEKRLHHRDQARRIPVLPPLLSMETLLFRLILLAFILLTLANLTGIAFSEKLFGQALTFDHKSLFAILSWLIFAALLIGRFAWGWRGRKALYWILAGFVALLLAYIGSRFVLEVILGRIG